MPRARTLPVIIGIGFVLAGCSSSPPRFAANGPRYPVGRPHYTVAPYQVNGVWYYPKADYDYDRTGNASWYGPGFDHRPTADGEIYDMNGLTAAHKTLPLPSVVEVTNLRNGRELRLRVNDRGPFVGDRLLDVSRRAAQLLGFVGQGTAPVRVRIVKDESIRVAEAAMHGEVGQVGYAAAVPAGGELAAATPPSRSRPPVQLAQSLPPSLRAQEVVAAPLPLSPVPPPQDAAPRPAEPAPPPTPRIAAPLAVGTAQEPPPRPVVAATSHRYWPSLIPEAQAEPLPSGFGLAVMRAARRDAAQPTQARGIFIQAGAFAVPENAWRVRARIAALGRVEVVTAVGSGAALYRVRLGPVASGAEARRLLGEVIDSGYPGARLVSE